MTKKPLPPLPLLNLPEPVESYGSDWSVKMLCEHIDEGQLILNPKFQRTQFVWDLTKRSRLIESILLGFPIPEMYVIYPYDKDNTSSDLLLPDMLDGLQRASTVHSFLKNEFALRNFQFPHLRCLEGRHYDDLPRDAQNRFLRHNFRLRRLRPTPLWGSDLANIVFDRLNAGKPATTDERLKGSVRGAAAQLMTTLHRAIRMATGRRDRQDPRNRDFGLALCVLAGSRMAIRNGHLVWEGVAYPRSGNDTWAQFGLDMFECINLMAESEQEQLQIEVVQLAGLLVPTFGEYAFKRYPYEAKGESESESESESPAPKPKHNKKSGMPTLVQTFLMANALASSHAPDLFKELCQKFPVQNAWNKEPGVMLSLLEGASILVRPKTPPIVQMLNTSMMPAPVPLGPTTLSLGDLNLDLES